MDMEQIIVLRDARREIDNLREALVYMQGFASDVAYQHAKIPAHLRANIDHARSVSKSEGEKHGL